MSTTHDTTFQKYPNDGDSYGDQDLTADFQEGSAGSPGVGAIDGLLTRVGATVANPEKFGDLNEPFIFENKKTVDTTGEPIVNVATETYKSLKSSNGSVDISDDGNSIDLKSDAGIKWLGEWEQKQYIKDEQVRDGSWTMIANKTTSDRAGIVPEGEELNIYEGLISESQVTAKQVIFGNRYSIQDNGYITGYRVHTVVGNKYKIVSVTDPTGTPKYNEVLTFTSKEPGWNEYNITPIIVGAGTTLDMVVIVNEPDPSPVTIDIDWNYSTPSQTTVPLAGQITHSNNVLGSLLVSKTDANSNDVSATLATLTIGDIFDDGIVRWSIQSVTDSGTYMTLGVSPQVQSSDGLKTFTIETVVATPITYANDADYWLTNPNVQGLYIADDSYDNIVPNETAYGIDISVQGAYVSPDWDIVAYSTGGAPTEGGGSGGGTNKELANGTITSSHEITLYYDGINYYPEIRSEEGGDVVFQLDSMKYILDCTNNIGTDGRARSVTPITFTDVAEDNKTLTQNFMYCDLDSGGLPRFDTTTGNTFITTESAGGIFTVPKKSIYELNGFSSYQETNNMLSLGDDRGAIRELYQANRVNTAYLDGCVSSLVIDTGVAPDSVHIETTSGLISQAHVQNWDAQNGNVGREYWILNHPTLGFHKIADLNELDVYSNGDSISNNDRFKLSVYGEIQNDQGTDKILLNLPSGGYGSDEDAINDIVKNDTTIPNYLRSTCFRICDLVLRYDSQSGGTWSNVLGGSETISQLGQNFGSNAGGTIVTSPVTSIGQTKTVAKSGGQFTDWNNAVNSILDASTSKPYNVLGHAGIYDLTNKLITSDHISLSNNSAFGDTIIRHDSNLLEINNTTGSGAIEGLNFEMTPITDNQICLRSASTSSEPLILKDVGLKNIVSGDIGSTLLSVEGGSNLVVNGGIMSYIQTGSNNSQREHKLLDINIANNGSVVFNNCIFNLYLEDEYDTFTFLKNTNNGSVEFSNCLLKLQIPNTVSRNSTAVINFIECLQDTNAKTFKNLTIVIDDGSQTNHIGNIFKISAATGDFDTSSINVNYKGTNNNFAFCDVIAGGHLHLNAVDVKSLPVFARGTNYFGDYRFQEDKYFKEDVNINGNLDLQNNLLKNATLGTDLLGNDFDIDLGLGDFRGRNVDVSGSGTFGDDVKVIGELLLSHNADGVSGGIIETHLDNSIAGTGSTRLDIRANGIPDARHFFISYGLNQGTQPGEFSMKNNTVGGALTFFTSDGSSAERLRIDSDGVEVNGDVNVSGRSSISPAIMYNGSVSASTTEQPVTGFSSQLPIGYSFTTDAVNGDYVTVEKAGKYVVSFSGKYSKASATDSPNFEFGVSVDGGAISDVCSTRTDLVIGGASQAVLGTVSAIFNPITVPTNGKVRLRAQLDLGGKSQPIYATFLTAKIQRIN